MSLKKRLDALGNQIYADLTPENRVRLMVEQQVSGSNDEAQRIARAAPMRSYNITEPAFAESARAIHHLIVAASNEILGGAAMLKLLQSGSFQRSLAALMVVRIGGELDPSPAQAETPETPASFCPERARLALCAAEAAQYLLEMELHYSLYIPLLTWRACDWIGFCECCQSRLGISGQALVRGYGDPKIVPSMDWLACEIKRLELGESTAGEDELVEVCRRRYEQHLAYLPKEEHANEKESQAE